jgi:hypothetical protein
MFDRVDRPTLAAVDEGVERRQGERAPATREHLHPGHLTRRQVGTAGEQHAGDDGGVDAASELAHQHEHREAGERIAGEERDVVGEDGVAGQPIDRRDEERDAEQVLGVGKRVRVGVEDRGVPQVPRMRHDRIAHPAQDPCIQHRIAEVAGKTVVESWQQLDVDGERQRDKAQRHQPRHRRVTTCHGISLE